jgi:N-acetylglucosamine-6-phosphate deacetylase
VTGLRAQLWLEGRFAPGWMSWSRGKLERVEAGAPPRAMAAQLEDFGSARIAPGFVDTLLHGFAGVDCGSGDSSELERLTSAAAAAGVTSFLAGFYPRPPAEMRKAAKAWNAWREATKSAAVARAAGWHVEGPFISSEYRGQLPADGIQEPSALNAKRFLESCGGWLKMSTIAPEVAGALDAAEVLRAAGVMPSIGHTQASYLDCEALAANGAVAVTHLGNRVLPLAAREPGPIGFAMEGLAAWTGVIPDMIHVAPETLRLWAGSTRLGPHLMAQSDCLSHTGLEAKEFVSGGKKLHRSGAVALDDKDALSGTLDPLPLLLHRCVRDAVLEEAQAIRMGCETPGAFLGDCGRLAPGLRADFVLLRGAAGLEVERVWIAGRAVGP